MIEAGWPVAALCAALMFAPLMTGLLLYLAPRAGLLEKLPVVLAGLLLVAMVPLSSAFLDSGPVFLAIGGHQAPLGIELQLDGLALAMLWLTAIVALAVAVYTSAALTVRGDDPVGTGFRLLWMPLWSALNALFLTADVFSLYVLLELVSLAAIALVTLDGGARAIGAASRYLLFALAGSTFYLLDTSQATDGSETVTPGYLAWYLNQAPALAFMTLGVAMKAALFPVHGWLPHAHAQAPSAASALLSGLVVTGGAYLIIRLWLGPFQTLAGGPVAQVVAAVGACGMLYGSLQALRQSHLKLLIAYSTVAQLGYLLLALPLASALALQGATLHAVSHGLAKAAFFLAAGNVIRLAGSDRLERLGSGDRRLIAPLAVMGVAGASLAGVPPTGGFMGKWSLASAAIDSGQWWWAVVLVGGGLLAAAYMIRILQYGFSAGSGNALEATDGTDLPRAMRWPPVVLATLAAALGIAVAVLSPWLPGGNGGGPGS